MNLIKCAFILTHAYNKLLIARLSANYSTGIRSQDQNFRKKHCIIADFMKFMHIAIKNIDSHPLKKHFTSCLADEGQDFKF